MYEIKKNEQKGDWCPWELIKDGKVIDAFTTEDLAIEHMELLKEIESIVTK